MDFDGTFVTAPRSRYFPRGRLLGRNIRNGVAWLLQDLIEIKCQAP